MQWCDNDLFVTCQRHPLEDCSLHRHWYTFSLLILIQILIHRRKHHLQQQQCQRLACCIGVARCIKDLQSPPKCWNPITTLLFCCSVEIKGQYSDFIYIYTALVQDGVFDQRDLVKVSCTLSSIGILSRHGHES